VSETLLSLIGTDAFGVWARRTACPDEGYAATARHLRLSRQKVWRAMRELSALGVEVPQSPWAGDAP
jgi:hypothetical protein